MKKLYKWRVIGTQNFPKSVRYRLELDMGKQINEGRTKRKKQPVYKLVTLYKLRELYDNNRIVGTIPKPIKHRMMLIPKLYYANSKTVEIVY